MDLLHHTNDNGFFFFRQEQRFVDRIIKVFVTLNRTCQGGACAGRGMGVNITIAALGAGHQVIATGRNPEKVKKAIGDHENLLVVKLDITNIVEAEATVKAGVERFGKIDVLVNNAANFNAGYFEELSMEEIEGQLTTSLFGPMKVTKAVLPSHTAPHFPPV